jgi:hypothetical protein
MSHRGSWYDRGPVIYVIEGQLDIERKHGRMFNFKAGVLTYITDLLTPVANGWPQDRIDELMPWNWVPPNPH